MKINLDILLRYKTMVVLKMPILAFASSQILAISLYLISNQKVAISSESFVNFLLII